MEETSIYVAITLISVITLGILLFLQSRRETQGTGSLQNEQPAEPQERLRNLVAARPGAGGGRNRAAQAQNARARMRVAQAQREQQEIEEAESGNSSDGSMGDRGPILPEGKIGKKKLARLQEKAEKKTRREEEERLRKEKKEEDDQKYELRKLEEETQAQEDKAKEEEERLQREEEERKEQEEYEKLKQQFAVDEEGFDENKDEDEEANLLQEFISYIEKSKVVVLEDLAALFKLKTQAAIDRIITLQYEGRLTGVIDDRGKFISISLEELENVAKFIKRRGRVSLSDLAEASNKLINVNPETVSAEA